MIQNLSINQIDSKQLANEVYRALGSLIYENGSKLNNFNLNRLFGDNDSLISNKKKGQELNLKDGLLFLMREQIETDMEEMCTSKTKDEQEMELNSKLNLITTQLIFNLTMPIENNTDDSSFSSYIEDKYKKKAIYLLTRILKFQNSTALAQYTHFKSTNTSNSFINETNRHFFHNKLETKQSNDEQTINLCKILTKSLQGIENLFASVQNLPSEQIQQLNWLQVHSGYFHLGDILSIAKVNIYLKFLFEI